MMPESTRTHRGLDPKKEWLNNEDTGGGVGGNKRRGELIRPYQPFINLHGHMLSGSIKN